MRAGGGVVFWQWPPRRNSLHTLPRSHFFVLSNLLRVCPTATPVLPLACRLPCAPRSPAPGRRGLRCPGWHQECPGGEGQGSVLGVGHHHPGGQESGAWHILVLVLVLLILARPPRHHRTHCVACCSCARACSLHLLVLRRRAADTGADASVGVGVGVALITSGLVTIARRTWPSPSRTTSGSTASRWRSTCRSGPPHNMDYNPTRWPLSPRIVMRCASMSIRWPAIHTRCPPSLPSAPRPQPNISSCLRPYLRASSLSAH